jgi:exopolyphosphatase/guanosine-5'-triphosphate,3'-diphosphate pyrophosphatase
VLLVKGQEPEISKAHSVRTPVRLGEDSFTLGYITKDTLEMMTHAFKAFYHLFKIYGVRKHMVLATSAMREADNREEVCAHIERSTGFQIQIIEGKKEAEIIYNSQLEKVLSPNANFLYMDVGGGSTELTFFESGVLKDSRSFKLGTIRIINELDEESEWQEMFSWLKSNSKGLKNLKIIGSGGNIKTLFRLNDISKGEELSLQALEDCYEELDSLTYDERIAKYEMNPDRADVVIPAAQLFIEVAHAVKSKSYLLYKVGLNDGAIHYLLKTTKAPGVMFNGNMNL